MELLKMLATNEIVAQVVCFLALLLLLRAVMWKKLLKVLDDRRERIATDLQKIEESKAVVERLKSDYAGKIDSIEGEARARIKEAVDEGKHAADQIRQKAEGEATKILEGAKQNIKIEMAKAKEELKDTVVDIAIDAASKVIQEQLTADMDRKIVETFVKEIESNK